MAQYDGSIRINTEIATNAAKKSLVALSSMITLTAKEISSLRSKMDALKGQKFYTDDYKKLQADLSKAEKELAEFVELTKSSGELNENQQKSINKQIEKYSSEIDSIKGKMQAHEEAGKAFTLGENTQEYANLERQLQYEEEALKLAAQHYQTAEKLNDPYGRLSQALNNLNSKMSSIIRMSQAIKQSFSSSDVNMSGYERLNSVWSELKGTVGSVVESMKWSFSEIRENGISAIVDMTNKMSSSLVSKLGDALERTSEKIGEILMKPVAAAMKAGQSIKYALGSAFDSIKEKAAGVAGSVINGILHPFQTIKSVARSALNGTASVLKSALTPALENIKARVAGVAASIINGINHPLQTMKKIADSAISGASKLLSGMASIGKKVGSSIKGVSSKLLSIGKSAKSASSGISSMGTGFKNMIKNAIGISSLYALFSKFRSAIKEGFGNLAQYSAPVNAALSSLKSSLTQLKNSLATAFAPILTAVAPALTSLINMVSKAATAVGMLIAALTGQKTFTKAKGVQEDYAASLGKTAKKAKEANKQLSSLDKLNNLTTNDSGDDDGSGTGGGAGIGDMFETVDIPSKIKDLADMIKKAWENADFTEIGTLLGEKLKKALESIPWDKIQSVAAKLGKSLATLINGFVEVEGLGYSIGNAIAQAINTGIIGLKSFAEWLHWDSVGKFISDGINGALENIDWATALEAAKLWGEGLATLLNNALTKEVFENVGKTIGNGLNTALTFAISFIEKFEWKKIGSNIGNGIKAAIETIDWELLGTTVGKAVQAIIDLFVGFVESKPWEDIGEKIATAINNEVKEIKLSDFTSALSDFVIGLLKELSIAIKKTDWEQVARDIVEAIKAIDWMGIASGLFDVGLQLINGLLEAFGELPLPVQIAAAAIGGFLLVLEGASILMTIASVIGGIVNAIGILVSILGGPLTLAIAAIIAVGALLIANWDKIKETAGKLKEKILEKWEEIKTNTKEKWESIKSDVAEKISDMKTDVSEKVSDIKQKISEKWQEISQNTKEKWQEIKKNASQKWKDMKTDAKESAKNIKEKFLESWEGVKTGTKKTWESIRDAIKGPINAIIGFINRMISGIVAGINSMTSALNNISFEVPDWIPEIGGKTFGFNLPQITAPQIPALAKGAVIPANNEFLAVLGDQKHGRNLEAPEGLIRQIVREETANNNQGGEITIKIPVEVDGKVLFELMKKLDLEQYRRTGRPSFQV